QRLGKLSELIRRDDSNIAASLSDLAQYLDITKLAGLNEGVDATLDATELAFQTALRDLEAFTGRLAEMRSVMRADSQRSATEIFGDAQEVREVQDLENAIEKSKATLVTSYGSLFRGIDTEWDAVISALEWTRRFLKFVSRTYSDSSLLDAACV